MKFLIIGSGGREHAIVWKLAGSKLADKIYCAPGNAGIYRQAELVNIAADDIENLARFAREKQVDITVVGPEQPLAYGIVDRFQQDGLKIVGPTRAAAEIESSKVFAKEFMRKYHIPTAAFMVFDNSKEALAFARESIMPVAIKADGLAAGKGVIIAKNANEAESAIRDIMQKRRFGDAGNRIVIEEALTGEETSVLAFTDGKNIVPMIPSQDHKQIGDGDTGPNTGGMGAYAPVPFISKAMQKSIHDLILQPTVDGLAEEGKPFRGILYAGLMITEKGPKVIEFNCRFGDPETQVVLPLMKSDLAELFLATANGDLEGEQVELHDRAAVAVVLASEGYPGRYEKGRVISGLKENRNDGIVVFHSGTRFHQRKYLTNGGRVLAVTATDEHLESAIAAAYSAVNRISFDGMQFRSDIGQKAGGRKFNYLE